MIVNVSFQAYIFFITILIGVLGGFLYDLVRILRRTIKHSNFFIHVEDFIYWVLVACFFFFVLFHKNYGEIRGFSFLGALIGAILYYLILSIWVMKISIAIIEYVKRIILFIVNLIRIPIRWILFLLSYPYRWIKIIFRFIFDKIHILGRKSYRCGKRKVKKAKKNLFIIMKKV